MRAFRKVGEEDEDVVSESSYDFTVDELVADPTLLTDNDFGNFEWFKISGHKYEDRDGTHQSTDYPLGGWTILLYKNT